MGRGLISHGGLAEQSRGIPNIMGFLLTAILDLHGSSGPHQIRVKNLENNVSEH